MKRQTENQIFTMKILVGALIIMTIAYQARADIEVGYAPYAPHYVQRDCCINDYIDLVSVSYKKFGVFYLTNSYGDPSYGMKYELDGPGHGRIGSSLYLGAVAGYYDRYDIHFPTSKIVNRGKPVIYPVVAPTLSLRWTDNLSTAVSQMGKSTVFSVRLKL